MEIKKKKVDYMDYIDGPITTLAMATGFIAALIVICGFSSAIVIREIGSAIETAQCHSTP
jgi:hypothetical protein